MSFLKRFSKNGIDAGTLSWSKVALLVIGLVSFWHLFYIRLNGDNWKNAIRSDGAGYYAFLPATFIYHDLTFKFAEEKSKTFQCGPGCDTHFFGSRTIEGKRINKYFIGTSIMQMPFFIVALTLSAFFDYPTTGYSFLFQAFICFAAIFYLLAGLYCLRKLLTKLNFKDQTIALVLALLFFGTNLYHYSLEEPSMSHVYSFAAISFFLLQVFCISEKYDRKNFILMAVSLAIIILIRPVNGIIIFTIPFLLAKNSDPRSTLKQIFADKKGLISSGTIVIILFFLQLLSWKLCTGNWIEDPYVGENLNILQPHIWTILFDFRKGLFIYTPILLFSMIGIFFIPKPFSRLQYFTFLFINIWVISSWHDLAYGGSFGMRPFVDTYSFLAIPLSFFIETTKNRLAFFLSFVVISFMVFLNLFQHYQYHLGILPYDEMTWKKYKKIFLHEEKVYAGIFSPGADELGNLPKGCKLISSYKRNFDNDQDKFVNQSGVVNDKISFSKPSCVKLFDSAKYCADLFLPIYEAVPDSLFSKTWVNVKAKVWLKDLGCDAKMVFTFKDNNNTYYWNGFFLVHRIDKTKEWCDYSFAIPMPFPQSKSELISVYVLKDDNELVYVDDLEISFWEK